MVQTPIYCSTRPLAPQVAVLARRNATAIVFATEGGPEVRASDMTACLLAGGLGTVHKKPRHWALGA